MAAASSSLSLADSPLRQLQGTATFSPQFHLLRGAALVRMKPLNPPKHAVGPVRCDYIGSPTNVIMVVSTTLSLLAGRFGLAPSANRRALAGLKLVDRESGLRTGDPAGFTGTDTLVFGTIGHIIGTGIVLGLKATGGI